ncbi:MAG: Nucleoside diphosphate kinase [Candidatus Collierbacteria bacterium GW2011_GWB1_45_35]|uniref:Nucleoside diphosphate kinase n=2 Tax=Candidatus Collieribacteriota TaxID=1752725 RepID=A0A0G1KT62_9BACT|nr:MAG: Nucleoside diphosphate kinase [Microgenomates group bacterium GW2011_GWC1_44_23]KKT86695.1 MAG: Nucleoside diphosphate kinase [Candidatus Collierbacteria bacterium GW2011_GWA2_44_99]KKT95358.1 MAG: Nucleoside diphosphate kinase [Candidatus Collierbacteria bacterium GW2011_GWA1_45_15]KKT99591.1 MAG: Nucleoside diphosphate kinase [Candidatus Collierbacteria bacterium GW2011_GWB2_45_17]KKU04935.1 MAG: Nucleoside diphosphate kinase [Candidatus Collierbacteria bacterium GW2011_GWB1_45_35]KK
MNKTERTLVLIKPDAVQRNLIGEIISRFEKKGFKLVAMKMVQLDDGILKKWYHEYKDAPFFPQIASFMSWTPIIAMILEGYNAAALVRRIVGTRKGYEAEAGSVRGDFGMSGGNNLVHASDSLKNAKREMKIVFTPEEIHEYKTITEQLIYSEDEIGGVFR